MKEELPKEKSELANLIIRNLSTAIKNSLLYAPNHPVFDFSIKNFKASLNKWFLEEKSMDLGISQDNLLVGGAYIKEKDAFYGDLADYLHGRGIIAISILKGVKINELTEFLKFIKNDIKTVREKGGILKNIPPTPHLKIKEIDYSSLLGSAREEVTPEDGEIWRSLSSVADESRGGKLPESKFEFLTGFLKNPAKSALVLNKVYKEGMAKLEGEATVQDMREALGRVYEYFRKDPGKDAKEARSSLLGVIAELDPDLVVRLFEQAALDGKSFDLAREITKDFSDDFIAHFIESLMKSKGAFSENLLKVFDKLTPAKDKADSVASIVADRLFEERLIGPATLSKLQLSIKEIFKTHPESNFMSEMYRITLEVFTDKKTGPLSDATKLSRLAEEYRESVSEKNLKKERIRLISNIIWLEDDPFEFEKFSAKLIDALPEILDSRNIEGLREVFELFIEKLRPGQRKTDRINSEANRILKKITEKELVEKIISFIPGADGKDIEDIVYMLLKAKANSANLLVERFISEKDQSRRRKFGSVLSAMKNDISEEVMRKMERCDPSVLSELFKILKEADPGKARLITKKLIWHEDKKIRLEAMEAFVIKTDEEAGNIFEIFKKGKNMEIQNKAITVLLKAGDKKTIDGLFRYIEGNFFKRKFLLKLVELCGYLKVREAVPHLGKILSKQPLFNTKRWDKLRIASAVSLRQLGVAEAMELIKERLNDKREPVRRMCRIITELDKTEK